MLDGKGIRRPARAVNPSVGWNADHSHIDPARALVVEKAKQAGSLERAVPKGIRIRLDPSSIQ